MARTPFSQSINVLAAPVPLDYDAISARVSVSKLNFLNEILSGIERLIARDDWRGAVRLAIEHGRLSEAELARGLEVTRSTVNRWVSGQTRPHPASIPSMKAKLEEMLRGT